MVHDMREPGRTAIGTWSGGRFLRFGEAIEEERLERLLVPGDGIDTVLTADAYGEGEADRVLGRAVAGVPRDDYCLVGAIGHDFYEGERDGPRGFPRFTDPRLRGEDEYAGYLRMATERSLERIGVDRFDLLLLHNPDRTGYSSEAVWDGMAALREAGLAGKIGVAPGPANGFTLDLIACLERFGERIDWAMIILNPFEPWPGELCLEAAAAPRRQGDRPGRRLRRSLLGRPRARYGAGQGRPPRLPSRRAGSRPGWRSWSGWRRSRERTALSPMQLACQWNLAQPAVECVVPTLIQEAGESARPIEDKRAELAALPEESLLGEDDIAEIRAIGDNSGCMALKGASPQHEGEERPDRWPLDGALAAVGDRWGIDPERDLATV